MRLDLNGSNRVRLPTSMLERSSSDAQRDTVLSAGFSVRQGWEGLPSVSRAVDEDVV